MTKRVLAAFLQQENNTFFEERSTLEHFRRGGLLRGAEISDRFRGTRTDWGVLFEESLVRSWLLTPALHAHAQALSGWRA